MNISSLKNNMIRLSLAVIIFTLGAASLSVILQKRSIQMEVNDHNTTMINFMVDQVKESIEVPLNLMMEMETLLSRGYDIEDRFISDYFEMIIGTYDYFTDIYITSYEGVIINMAPYDEKIIGTSTKNEPYYVAGNDGRIKWSKVYISTYTGEPTLSVTVTRDDYLITANLDLRSLPISYVREEDYDQLSEISIIDQWGTYIVSEDMRDVTERKQHPYYRNLQEAIDIEFDLENIGFVKIESLGWYVIYEVDESLMYSSANQLAVIIAMIWLSFSIVLFVLVYQDVKKVENGLVELQATTKRIIEGDYVAHKFYFSFSEFENLSEDFQVMSDEIDRREKHIRDINKKLEYKVMERTEALQLSVKIAQDANDAKSHFLAVMSHEMRSPLNGIIGFLQILELSHFEEEERGIISTIKSSSHVLLSLINDLLDVTKYEVGKIVFEEARLDLNRYIKNAIMPYKKMAAKKDVDFVLNYNTQDTHIVKTDATKLSQLFANLLDNALKFTEVGSIEVTVNVFEINSLIRLEVNIKDTGIGIKASALPKLFNPFIQADESITREYGGSGLGLTICKEIVAYLKGEITVSSTEKVGTSFEFYIMLEKFDDQALDIGQLEREEPPIITEGKVLIVEDNDVNQSLLTRFFNRYKVPYDMASNGKEALQLFDETEHYLILMDCQMPIMDGFEATRAIKALSPSTRIIAMTAYATKEDEAKCFAAGMDKFMTKPLDLRNISKVIGFEKAYMKDLSDSKNQGQAYENPVEIYARRLEKQIGFDYETCHDLITTYIEQTRDIYDAIIILQKDNDVDGLKRRLHQLKGATSAVRLTELSKEIEKAEAHILKGDINIAMDILEKLMEHTLLKSV